MGWEGKGKNRMGWDGRRECTGCLRIYALEKKERPHLSKMNNQQRNAVNLSVLKRHDAKIDSIVESISYVVVYDFDSSQQVWVKEISLSTQSFTFLNFS
jgi:predicted Fe-S protein YdhL (DUF1289 family)